MTRAYDRTKPASNKLQKEIKKDLDYLQFYNNLLFGLREGPGPIFQPPSYEHPIMQEEMLKAFARKEAYPLKNKLISTVSIPAAPPAFYHPFPEINAWTDEQYQLAEQERKNKYLKARQKQQEEWARDDARMANQSLEITRNFGASPGEITPRDIDWKEFLKNYTGR